MGRKVTILIPPALILGALLFFARGYLLRDLWFDEALTILNFALQESPGAIYHSYIIPNNQIIYTIALHYWIMLLPDGIDPTVWCRLLSLLFGGATLVALYALFRTRLSGGWLLTPALLALAVSPPFLIYATALRGYMASAFFITLALHFALKFAARPDWKRAACYAGASLLAVGTIPSNLAILAGTVLYALPLFGDAFYRRRAFWILSAIPVATALLFYLPIYQQFLGVLKLGEGWNNGFMVLQAVLTAFAYSFAMLLIPATGSILAFDRKRYHWVRSARAAIWLLPIPMALLLPVAPFPRVFFPFWPLWTLLLAGGVRDLTALNCRWRRRWNFKIWIGALVAVVIGWGFVADRPELRLAFSRRNGGAGADDFFYGYYLRPNHTPRATAAGLIERSGGQMPGIYSSFAADPWPLMFYLQTQGAQISDFRFDGPRGKVTSLEPGMLVILRADEPASAVEMRFQRKLELLFSNLNHGVYLVE